MVSVTVHAGSLRRMLDVLLLTTVKSPSEGEASIAGVHLRTQKAMAGGGVSQTQALTGTTTTGTVVGRMHVSCNGELAAPVLLPIRDVPWLSKVLQEVHRDDKEGLVTLMVGEDLSARWVIETRQATSHQAVLESASDFPLSTCEAMLDGSASAEVVVDKDSMEPLPAGCMTRFPGAYHSLLGTVSAKLNADVDVFRMGHPAGVHLVSVGAWRGALSGSPYPVDASVDGPDEQETIDQAG